jgi:hypothetical protein
MQKPTKLTLSVVQVVPKKIAAPSLTGRSRPAVRRRHLEAHAVAWLRALRAERQVHS